MLRQSVHELLSNPLLGLRLAHSLPENAVPRIVRRTPAVHGALPASLANPAAWLRPGGLHEWLPAINPTSTQLWNPPLTLLAALALTQPAADHNQTLVCIGRVCWPTLHLLCTLLGTDPNPRAIAAATQRFIFIDPQSDEERFWALAQTLRCPGVAAVIADGSAMTPTISRRLQLAAESAGVLALVARPPWEASQPSWAMTRWHVRPRVSNTAQPRWHIALTRSKGVQPGHGGPQQWMVNYEKGALHFSADLGSGSLPPPEQIPRSAIA